MKKKNPFLHIRHLKGESFDDEKRAIVIFASILRRCPMNRVKFLTLILVVLVVACENNSSPKDADATITDGDEAVLVADDGDDLLGDDEQNDEDTFVRECYTSAECDESEFCDPYGSCMCDKGKGYTIRYNGKCMLGTEGAAFFCNNRANGYYIKQSVPRKGPIAYTDSVDDVVCLCGFGYWGQNCQFQIEGYDELLPVFEPNHGIVPQIPDPDCITIDDCAEGMECGEQGYCQCPGVVTFEDPSMDQYVRNALGISPSDDILGSQLVMLLDFMVIGPQKLENMHCMQNLRGLDLSEMPADFDFTPVLELKHLQALTVTSSNYTAWDYSPLKNHPTLLSLQLNIGQDNYQFLEDLVSAPHIVQLRLSFTDEKAPSNFDFLKKFSQLTALELTFNEDLTSEASFPFDVNTVADLKELALLRIFAGSGEIKNLSALEKLNYLTHLAITQNPSIEDNKPKTLVKLTDFPVLPSVVELYLDSLATNGEYIIDHFPNVTLYTYSNHLMVNADISMIKGMTNLKTLNFFNWDLRLPRCEEIDYSALGELLNLNNLTIGPYCKRESDWMRSLKYMGSLWLQSGDLLNYGKRKEEYAATGPVDTPYIADLLYLHDYYDQLYRFETADIFVKNCDNGGLLCNKDFQKSYFFAGEGSISLSLCGNPIPLDDPSALELVNRGVGVSVGEMNDCTWLSPGTKAARSSHFSPSSWWTKSVIFHPQGKFDSWTVTSDDEN